MRPIAKADYTKPADTVVESQRGSWARMFPLAEKDIRSRCLVWLKAQRRVTAKEFAQWLNANIMSEPKVVEIIGEENKQICEETARVWLHKLGCSFDAKQKSYYTDTHEEQKKS